MSIPPSKQALLDTIQSAWDELNEIISGLNEEQLTQPGAQEDWSIKDIMAHIAAWERLAADRIHAALSGEELQYPPMTNDDAINAFNAQAHEEHKGLPLKQVSSEFGAAHQAFLMQIEALDESRLAENLPFDWAGKVTFQVLISANAHWHYAEHIAAIEKWLDAQE